MSEVVNAVVKTIVTLLIGHGSHPIRIHKFYEKLLVHVKSLEKMGKLNTIKEYVETHWINYYKINHT